jgi:site-specific DNA recombinase
MATVGLPSFVQPSNASDVAAAGGIDQVYVHCPDRLARNYAHQVLLLEEFMRDGVEVIFNREVGQTPEDQLLLQVQGMIAEYERAKILERSRRGKRHGAQVGKVSVLGGAPHGYRYVTKQEGAGEAQFEVVWEEARVVRQVFEWVGRDRCSIGEVRRRLEAAKERTRTGKTVWDRATIGAMLHNPAYKGEAAFGKTVMEPLRPRLRAQRGQSLQPKHAYSHRDVPSEQWMSIPVPALVQHSLTRLPNNCRKIASPGSTTGSSLFAARLDCGCLLRVCLLRQGN